MAGEVKEPFAHTQTAVEHALANDDVNKPSWMCPDNMDIT